MALDRHQPRSDGQQAGGADAEPSPSVGHPGRRDAQRGMGRRPHWGMWVWMAIPLADELALARRATSRTPRYRDLPGAAIVAKLAIVHSKVESPALTGPETCGVADFKRLS